MNRRSPRQSVEPFPLAFEVFDGGRGVGIAGGATADLGSGPLRSRRKAY
jgi:hypothetical protein